jgi:hypothetical protein
MWSQLGERRSSVIFCALDLNHSFETIRHASRAVRGDCKHERVSLDSVEAVRPLYRHRLDVCQRRSRRLPTSLMPAWWVTSADLGSRARRVCHAVGRTHSTIAAMATGDVVRSAMFPAMTTKNAAATPFGHRM